MRWLALTVVVAGIGAHANDVAAQEAPRRARWAIVPQVAFGSIGRRWEGETVLPADSIRPRGARFEQRLGPGQAPLLGLAVEYDPPGRTEFELLGGVMFSDYAYDREDVADVEQPLKVRGAGSLRIFRFAGSMRYRLRENVPGYFTIGAGALYHQPRERFVLVGEFKDPAQWMPSAHAGLGFDIRRADQALRLDFRVYAVRPGRDPVLVGTVPFLEPRDVALDYAFALGYLFRL